MLAGSSKRMRPLAALLVLLLFASPATGRKKRRRRRRAAPAGDSVLGAFMLAQEEGDGLERAVEWSRSQASARTERARALLREGADLHGAGRSAEALSLWRSAVEADPASARARSHSGAALRALGRGEEAAAAYAAAARLAPQDGSAVADHGSALHDLGRHTEALQRHWQATELDPGLAQSWANLGMLLGDGAVGVGPSEGSRGTAASSLTALDRWAALAAADAGYAAAAGLRGAGGVGVSGTPAGGGEAARGEAGPETAAVPRDHLPMWLHRGNQLGVLRRHGEAALSFRLALRAFEREDDPERRSADAPTAAALWLNLATSLLHTSRDGERGRTLDAYRRAAALDPSLQDAWLMQGEARFRAPPFPNAPVFERPRFRTPPFPNALFLFLERPCVFFLKTSTLPSAPCPDPRRPPPCPDPPFPPPWPVPRRSRR
jgi:tetratricopeptide (TPR) repeat protein